jgi:hypothetical protein
MMDDADILFEPHGSVPYWNEASQRFVRLAAADVRKAGGGLADLRALIKGPSRAHDAYFVGYDPRERALIVMHTTWGLRAPSETGES